MFVKQWCSSGEEGFFSLSDQGCWGVVFFLLSRPCLLMSSAFTLVFFKGKMDTGKTIISLYALEPESFQAVFSMLKLC